MRTNGFTLKMSKKSNVELEGIIEEKSKYTEEALQAAIWELENRNLIERDEIKLEDYNPLNCTNTPSKGGG